LGIGINTAVFSVVSTVFFGKAPYADPDRLVSVLQRFPRLAELTIGACPAEYLDYRDRSRAFSSVAGRKLTIIGIARDVHITAVDSVVNPTIYSSVYQIESGATTSAVFIVRTRSGDPAALASTVRAAIWSVDRNVPVFDIRTMDQIVSRSLTARRFALALLSSFAILALALAVVGLYGVLSYAVAQRTSELGIRFALGATPGRVLRLVIGEGLRLTFIGLGAGAILGALAARAMSRLVFGIPSFDAATFAITAALLLVVAVLACLMPAWRASRVDPMVALRCE
jgi:putative ABC transport system permease protein